MPEEVDQPHDSVAPRQSATRATNRTPHELGVDEGAFRRGRRYVAILVDADSHHIIDLVQDGVTARASVSEFETLA